MPFGFPPELAFSFAGIPIYQAQPQTAIGKRPSDQCNRSSGHLAVVVRYMRL